jgi:hypothetical protein
VSERIDPEAWLQARGWTKFEPARGGEPYWRRGPNGHYIAWHAPGDPCWCTYDTEHPDAPSPFTCQRCHSFLVDGQIQFLGDCTHALAGQTVPLPEIEP